MLFRFAVAVTLLELVLTFGASVMVSYTEPPPGFATEVDLRDLGLAFSEYRNARQGSMNSPVYESYATLSSPDASLKVVHRADASHIDFDFSRAREDIHRSHPERGEVVVINEPLPGELGYAVRHRHPDYVRFELVRLRGKEMLTVRVIRKVPFDTLPAAELSKCERRARVVQEHLMMKLRWRE